MSIKKDYYKLHRAMRMRDLAGIFWMARSVDYKVFEAVDEVLSPRIKVTYSLAHRLIRYRRIRKLVPKRYRM